MNSRLNWNDYETVLKIADAGSLSKAAHMLGSSHPTVFRKLNVIEQKLGVRLFERFRTGYEPTAAGEKLLSTARQMAELANDTERCLSGQDLQPFGVVRITTTDALATGLLTRQIARFRQLQPNITLEIAVSNDVFNLSLREADIAIRPTSSPEDHLVGRKLGLIRQAVYAHHTLSIVDDSQPPWKAMPWIGPSRSMPYGQLHRWMGSVACDEKCVCRMDSVLAMYAAVKSGIGVAVLPCYLAENDTDLIRVTGPVDDVAVPLWILTHPDLRHTARVRATLEHFSQLSALL